MENQKDKYKWSKNLSFSLGGMALAIFFLIYN